MHHGITNVKNIEKNIKFWCIVGYISQYPMRVFYTYSLRNKFPNPNDKFILWSAKKLKHKWSIKHANTSPVTHEVQPLGSSRWRWLLWIYECMCINMGKVPVLLSEYITLSTFIYLFTYLFMCIYIHRSSYPSIGMAKEHTVKKQQAYVQN